MTNISSHMTKSFQKKGIIVNTNTIVRKLELVDCTSDLLAKFNRYQEVQRCWRKEGNVWTLKDISYTEQWDEKKKQTVILSLIFCLQNGGRVVGAFIGNTLVGFASINAEPFGSQNQYVNLDMTRRPPGFE